MIDILFLACAVTFCATTFAREELFTRMGLSPGYVHYILGIASIVAFFVSLVALRVDWKGKAARHTDAVQKLTNVLSKFRECRRQDGAWLEDEGPDLHRSYWEAMNNVVEIPSGPFVGLKVRYLRNIELSKMSDSFPGCPLFLLRLILFIRSILAAFKKTDKSKKETMGGTGH
ncbi:MAG: hypothetical protein ACFFCW_33190 [Candidatus Hodarchaeota archaeon]